MRRRFGRGRRRNASTSGDTPIDAALWLPHLLEAGVLPVAELAPVGLDGIPESFALLGEGQREEGGAVRVGLAPERGGDAALAVLALEARRRAEGAAAAELFAVTPDWSGSARRSLALLRPRLPLQAVALGAAPGGSVRVAPDVPLPAPACATQLAARLVRADERELFARARSAFEGLAAKHGGALRARGDRLELVLLAQRVAALVAEPGSVRIEVSHPERASLPLETREGLATVLDRLEGSLRKVLNDRRVRTSEARMRSALIPLLERAGELSAGSLWPLGDGESEPVEMVGIASDGTTVVGAARERLGMSALAEILDAAASSPGIAQALAREAELPPPGDRARLLLAAGEFEPAVLDVLAWLELDARLFDVRTLRGGAWGLGTRELAASFEPAPLVERPAPARGRGSRRAELGAATSRAAAEPQRTAAPRGPVGEGEEFADEQARPRFEEVSLFDLDEEPLSEEGGGRRRRGRRRGRRGRGAARLASDETGSEAAAAPGPESGRAPSRDDPDADDDRLLDADDDDALVPLAVDLPELDEVNAPTYDDEEESEEDDSEEGERARRERERPVPSPAVETERRPAPRRRAAFVAHADAVSVLSAVVLARDLRLVEGFWVYPQSELMTFFRSVATDLREETPIFLVGFAASPPARDTLQAAALYRGRLDWFDHHEWPPEDLEALRETIGADRVHVTPGAESSLASVIGQRTRRSRFSDKLVELVSGRFTQHDYERWGRLWWYRAHEIAQRSGERRAEIDPLLSGRPSDLARESARLPEPPVPPEVAYVSERDFRIVHFGGFTMVVLAVPPELDLPLAARIARERYEAQISLATTPGGELVVLGGDDSRARRGLDLGGLAAHLAAKHEWVEALPDDDHVARLRVRGLHGEAGRFDELISEIAMGRSIVEG